MNANDIPQDGLPLMIQGSYAHAAYIPRSLNIAGAGPAAVCALEMLRNTLTADLKINLFMSIASSDGRGTNGPIRATTLWISRLVHQNVVLARSPFFRILVNMSPQLRVGSGSWYDPEQYRNFAVLEMPRHFYDSLTLDCHLLWIYTGSTAAVSELIALQAYMCTEATLKVGLQLTDAIVFANDETIVQLAKHLCEAAIGAARGSVTQIWLGHLDTAEEARKEMLQAEACHSIVQRRLARPVTLPIELDGLMDRISDAFGEYRTVMVNNAAVQEQAALARGESLAPMSYLPIRQEFTAPPSAEVDSTAAPQVETTCPRESAIYAEGLPAGIPSTAPDFLGRPRSPAFWRRWPVPPRAPTSAAAEPKSSRSRASRRHPIFRYRPMRGNGLDGATGSGAAGSNGTARPHSSAATANYPTHPYLMPGGANGKTKAGIIKRTLPRKEPDASGILHVNPKLLPRSQRRRVRELSPVVEGMENEVQTDKGAGEGVDQPEAPARKRAKGKARAGKPAVQNTPAA